MVKQLVLASPTVAKAICEKWKNGAYCKEASCPRYHPQEYHVGLCMYLKERGKSKSISPPPSNSTSPAKSTGNGNSSNISRSITGNGGTVLTIATTSSPPSLAGGNNYEETIDDDAQQNQEKKVFNPNWFRLKSKYTRTHYPMQ